MRQQSEASAANSEELSAQVIGSQRFSKTIHSLALLSIQYKIQPLSNGCI